MSTTKRTHRVGIALAVACVMGVALAVVGASSALAQKGEQTKKPAERVKALVLGNASSPMLDELKRKEGWQLTQAANAKGRGNDPSKYDALIVDGDAHSPQQLGEGTLVDRFADANRWVLALDMDPADYDQGLIEHTGFTVEERSEKSAMFLFSRQMLKNSPRVVMIEAKSLKPLLSENMDQEWLSQSTARHTQKIASTATRAVSADRSTLEEEYTPAGDTTKPDEAQTVHWTYADTGSSAPPYPGHWVRGGRYCVKACGEQYQIDAVVPEPGEQTTNWSLMHYFDAYLDNGNRPQGNFQYLTHRLEGHFSPKLPGEKFVQMFDPIRFLQRDDPRWFDLGTYQMERAWWTQQLAVQVRPDAQTNAKLVPQQSLPATPDSMTHYSTKQHFHVDITASDEGAGINTSYDVENGEDQDIPDWGVENKGSGNELYWLFSARQPCDLRDGVNKQADCFIPGLDSDAGMPKRPTDLSLGQLPVSTFSRWRTQDLLSEQNGKATFQIKTPVALADSVCTSLGFIGCAADAKAVDRGAVGTNPANDYWTSYSFDISAVNPIPINTLTFSPSPANGAKLDKVTGTVTLERPASYEKKVVIYSDNRNAVVGVPLPSGASKGTATIPQGAASANFQILTNDNNLKPGDHTTATITAFLTTPKQEQLRVESPLRGSSKP